MRSGRPGSERVADVRRERRKDRKRQPHRCRDSQQGGRGARARRAACRGRRPRRAGQVAKRTEEHDQPQRAEVSNYEIVSHWFGEAAERWSCVTTSPPSCARPIARSRYRFRSGQDGRFTCSRGTACSTMAHGAVQRRHPLPSRGRPGRGAGACRADDLEDGDRRHPLRRRQRWGEHGPQEARGPRAAGRHAILHEQDRESARPHAGHPRAGRGYRRPGHGLDHGRVRQAARPHAGDCHGQADRPRDLRA